MNGAYFRGIVDVGSDQPVAEFSCPAYLQYDGDGKEKWTDYFRTNLQSLQDRIKNLEIAGLDSTQEKIALAALQRAIREREEKRAVQS